MTKKIGVVTGGGDCPGLNAVIRAVAKSAWRRGWEVLGVVGGSKDYCRPPTSARLITSPWADYWHEAAQSSGLPTGVDSRQKSAMAKSGACQIELLEETKQGMERLGLSALISIGGDGSLSIAQQLHEHGVPIVGVPKTIDNDLDGTVMTFGFDSAVACATDAIDRLHTTAESHNRVMVLEVMGRYAGWIALYSGVAGGADVILIPEIPFSYESVCAKLHEREQRGRQFSIVVVAEGARPAGADFVTSGASSAPGEARLGGIGAIVTAEIEKRTGKEARCCVLGHLQRGGPPTTFDRALCSIFGAEAVELVAANDFGKMVAYQGSQVAGIPIMNAVGKLKTVAPGGNLARTARALGICLGD